MADGIRRNLLSKLDRAVVAVADANVKIAAQEKRVVRAKEAGWNFSASQTLLDTMRESLRLHEAHYDKALLEVERQWPRHDDES